MSAGNTNYAPFPEVLDDLVTALHYKPLWSFDLAHLDRGQGSAGLTLAILIDTPDSYNPEVRRSVVHYFPVPPAAYDMRSWRHWLFDCVLDVESHEAMEFFTIDGDKPYAPSHGPGNDPYIVREVGTDEDRRTSYKGVLAPESEGRKHSAECWCMGEGVG
jgi:hypothetical protein